MRNIFIKKKDIPLLFSTYYSFSNLGRNQHNWSTIWDPHIFIGDPQILVGDPYIFIGDPIFSLETRNIFFLLKTPY